MIGPLINTNILHHHHLTTAPSKTHKESTQSDQVHSSHLLWWIAISSFLKWHAHLHACRSCLRSFVPTQSALDWKDTTNKGLSHDHCHSHKSFNTHTEETPGASSRVPERGLHLPDAAPHLPQPSLINETVSFSKGLSMVYFNTFKMTEIHICNWKAMCNGNDDNQNVDFENWRKQRFVLVWVFAPCSLWN